MVAMRDKKSAIPGGGLPYRPSEFGYLWVEESDGAFTAVPRDNSGSMAIYEMVGGQWGWEFHDDYGLVEQGKFSGVSGDAVFWRADRLLSEFDDYPVIPPKSFGYEDTYNENQPDQLFSHPY
ncbi:hypothetical protein KHQ84_gp024 [Rhodococcus phage Finch]|uniref:Uncharacterized protein n=1 Tax=Rhodococcus phage Finch TaxID=2094144 RepID=A0A2P1JXW1_9CAUD|nr:hypothetical protein KHQ84_gp024 [Rhodococcus phage Finch]AVO25162.1 hypothetical protein SEA_FINCH_24 [Rhodococcus phage Finch]